MPPQRSPAPPYATGWQATWYGLRTTVLPFVFIFNPQLLMIGVGSWVQVVIVCVTGTIASLLFAAATMKWFRTRCTWPEVGLLLLATFLFFRPDWLVDRFSPKHVVAPPADIYKVADTLGEDDWLISHCGQTLRGESRPRRWRCRWREPTAGNASANGGVTVAAGKATSSGCRQVRQRARKLGVEQGYKITELKLPNPARPSQNWVFIPAALLALGVWWLQGLRMRRSQPSR